MRNPFDVSKDIFNILGELAGYASMCWSETPKGVFDSVRCQAAVNDAQARLNGLLLAGDGKSEISKAIEVLARELKRDAGYMLSWKANIAMAFVDEMHRRGFNFEGLHEAANVSAENFLSNLCRDSAST